MSATASRACNVCRKKFKRTTQFWHRQPRRKDGLDETCKSCANARARAWYQANRDRVRAEAKTYRDDYPEDVREEKQESRLRNIKHIQAYQGEYNRRNSARRVAYTAQWRKEHPAARKREYDRNKERIKQRAKDWYRANRDRVLARQEIERIERRIVTTTHHFSSFTV